MTNALKIVIFPFFLIGCTLAPRNEYMDSDNLSNNLSINDMNGIYLISQSALVKLENYYSIQQIDSMKFSTIEINSNDSKIKIQNAPLNNSTIGEYIISSGEGKLEVTKWNHEKFRFIERPDSQYPKMIFRQQNGEKLIILVSRLYLLINHN